VPDSLPAELKAQQSNAAASTETAGRQSTEAVAHHLVVFVDKLLAELTARQRNAA